MGRRAETPVPIRPKKDLTGRAGRGRGRRTLDEIPRSAHPSDRGHDKAQDSENQKENKSDYPNPSIKNCVKHDISPGAPQTKLEHEWTRNTRNLQERLYVRHVHGARGGGKRSTWRYFDLICGRAGSRSNNARYMGRSRDGGLWVKEVATRRGVEAQGVGMW